MRDFCYVERQFRADPLSSTQNPCAGSNIGLDMKHKEKKEKKYLLYQNAIWIYAAILHTNIFIQS